MAGIHRLIVESIESCAIDVRSQFYGGICICGGSTLFTGFADRLKKELSELVPKTYCSVIAPPERKYSVWIGGSILASLSCFQDEWVFREDYEEVGPSVINRTQAI